MKKFVCVVFALLVAAGCLYSEGFSIGGGVGSVTIQKEENHDGYGVLASKPDFSVMAEFSSENFGIRGSVDFSFSREEVDNGEKEYTGNDVHLCLVPYFSWKNERWTCSAGPLIGVNFYKYNKGQKGENPSYKASETYFIWGSDIGFKYELSSHISAYMNVPVVFAPSCISETEENNGVKTENKDSSFGYYADVYAVPRIGIIYKFQLGVQK